MKGKSHQLNRYEEAMYSIDRGPFLFRSILAGASRAARVSRCLESEHLQTLWNTSTNIVGPVLLGFVLWTFRQARALGVNRLYFVSRDGQILYRLAELINERFPTGIASRYLYGSRHAWQPPSVTAVDEQTLDWVLAPTSILTVRCVCERVNLEPEEIRASLGAGGFTRESWDLTLSAPERQRLRQCFHDQAIQSAIVERAVEFRVPALHYLEQEGLLDDERFAIVDLGWNGRLQAALSRMLLCAGFRPQTGIKGLYFGLWRRVRACETDVLQSYFLSPEKPAPSWFSTNYVGLLEIFTAADHDGVRGYHQRQGGPAEPLFFDGAIPPAVEWGVQTQQEGVVHFAKELLQVLTPDELHEAGLFEASEKLLQMFCTNPTDAEAQEYGLYQVSEHQTGKFSCPLAPHVGHRGVWRHLTTGRSPAHSGGWLEGAVRRSGLHPVDFYLWLLRTRVRMRYHYRALRHRYK
jgi:hypothetical protein